MGGWTSALDDHVGTTSPWVSGIPICSPAKGQESTSLHGSPKAICRGSDLLLGIGPPPLSFLSVTLFGE